MYVNIAQSGYSVSERQTGVAVVDATTHSLITFVQTRADIGQLSWQGLAVSPDGKRVYVVDPSTSTLSIIDTGTNTVIGTEKVGGSPYGVVVSPDGQYVYVTNQADNTLTVISV